jgi:hypothetical protein
MFASSAARLPNEEEDLDIGTPSPAETPPVDDSVAPQPAQVPIIDDAPPSSPAGPAVDLSPPPVAGTTTPDEALDATIANAGTGPDLGPPAVKPLPDLTPPAPTTPIGVEHAKLEDAAVTAEQNDSLVRQRALQEEQGLKARQALDADKHAAAVQKVIEDHENRLQALLEKKQEYFDAARNAPFHDLYAERSTGDRILGAIAVFLGGLGGGQNQAMQILDTRMKHAYDKQAADIEGKWKLYGEQSKNVEDAIKGKDDALSNLKLLQSARYEAAADQLAEMKVRQGIPAEQAQSDKDVVAIRQKASDIRMKEAADATKEAELKTKEDLERRLKESEIRKNDAQAGKLGRHGGGGTGGSDALSQFVEASGQLKPGDPIPASLAVLGQRAGLKTNQIAAEVDKYRNTGSKSEKLANGSGSGGGSEDKEVNKRMESYQKEAIGNAKSQGPVRVLSQVEAMRHGLDEAVKSGDSDKIKAAAIKAKEQAGTLMSGGKLTQAQLKILHELESTTDEMVSKIGKFTGSPTEGAGAVKRLQQVIDDAGTETLAQISDIRQRGINEHLGPNGLAKSEEAKRTFMNRNAGLYSMVKWHGKPVFDEGKTGAMSSGTGEQATKTPGGSVAVPADASERAAKAQRAMAALANPSLTPEQKAKARDYLISIGQR